MKLTIKSATGKSSQVTIDKTRHFVFKGGEKTVYRIQNTAYAVYHDPKAATPQAKVQELSVLTDTRIIKPADPLFNGSQHVGETMTFVDKAHVLVQLFPRTFRERVGLEPDRMLELIKKLQAIIKHVHSHKILIVDLREMNFLVRDDFTDLYAIDVAAWHTPSFHELDYGKCLIGPMHRDPYAKTPTQESDWFSFAIIACQMAIGFHPYRGNHPNYTGDQAVALERRFRDHVSIFNPKTIFPKRASYPFDVLPPVFRGWLEAELERGERSAPPDRYDAAVVVAVVPLPITTTSVAFNVQKLFTATETITGVYYPQPQSTVGRVVRTIHGYYVGDRYFPRSAIPTDAQCVFSDIYQPYWAYVENDKLQLRSALSGDPVALDHNARLIVSYEGRLIFVNRTQAMELTIRDTLTGPRTSTSLVGQVLDVPEAIRAYDGVLVQNMLGRYHCTVFPAPGKSRIVKLPELDGTQILDAKYCNGVLVLLASDDKVYTRYLVRFNEEHDKHDVQVTKNVAYGGVNFTAIPAPKPGEAGAFLLVDQDGNLLFGKAKYNSASPIQSTADSFIDTSTILAHHGSKVLVMQGTGLYQISMK